MNHRAREKFTDETYKRLDCHSNFDSQYGTLYSIVRDISEQIKLKNEYHGVAKELRKLGKVATDFQKFN